MEYFEVLLTWNGLMYLIILALLEIVLGIDNIIFISVVTDKLPKDDQRKARNLGLLLALLVRLLLLAFVSWLMKMDQPFVPDAENDFVRQFSVQSIILLLGGLFLIYKSTIEMHSAITGKEEHAGAVKKTLSAIITQIILIDIVFSFDSIITAIGMTNGLAKETGHNPLAIIYAAVIISMIVMMLFAKPISDFINDRPTIKMIALSFLVTIGVILVAEAFGQHLPKGYIYFAMAYSLLVEFLNIRMRKNREEKEKLRDKG